MSLYERVVQLCTNKGIEISNLGKEMGIKLDKSTISHWKGGSVPRRSTVKAIADYFGVTVEYLTSDAPAENSNNLINGNNNIIGNGNTVGKSFTEQEKALLDIFESLDVVKQAQLLAFAADLAK